MTRRSTSPVTTAAVLVAAFVLSACAGSSGKPDAAPAAAPADAAQLAPAAQPAPAAGAQPATQEVAATDRSEEIVCKRYQVTGSRIATRKVCKTRQEWVEYSQHMKNAMRAAERRSAGAGAPPSMGGG